MKLKELDFVGTLKWVQEKINEYPELNWLLDEKVEHTEEGTSSQHINSWSYNLKGAHYLEFERTMCTLVNLYIILEGSEKAYDRFVETQPKEEILTKENFRKLHSYARPIISNHADGLKAMEVDLILGDMGKTPKARELAQKYSVEEKDHDFFLKKCLNVCPSIFPTFDKLSFVLQEELKENTGLVHYGHLVHLEGGPEILKDLKESEIMTNNPLAFDLQLLAYILDVSGSRAHETNQGSRSLANNTFLAVYSIKEALTELVNNGEKEAIEHYISFRAKLLGLSLKNPEDLVLTRLGTMMRLFTPSEGNILKMSFMELAQSQKDFLIDVFDPLRFRNERTYTYIPAVFVNFISSAIKQGMNKREAIQMCLQEAIVSIGVFIKSYREGKLPQPYSPHLSLNFNKIAGEVKNDINIFTRRELSIDDMSWNVVLTPH